MTDAATEPAPKKTTRKKATAKKPVALPPTYAIVGEGQAIVKRKLDGELSMAVGPVMNDWLRPGESLFFVGRVEDASARMFKSVTRALDDAQDFAWGKVNEFFDALPEGQYTPSKFKEAVRILRERSR